MFGYDEAAFEDRGRRIAHFEALTDLLFRMRDRGLPEFSMPPKRYSMGPAPRYYAIFAELTTEGRARFGLLEGEP